MQDAFEEHILWFFVGVHLCTSCTYSCSLTKRNTSSINRKFLPTIIISLHDLFRHYGSLQIKAVVEVLTLPVNDIKQLVLCADNVFFFISLRLGNRSNGLQTVLVLLARTTQ